jgi:hypothetical protein
MQRDTDFLIRRIYDAVDNVDTLPDVLSGLCERIGGENGILGILMKTPGPLTFAVLFRLDPSLMPTLNARHLNNVWRRKMVTLPVGIPAASDSFVPFDQVRGTDFYGEILEPWSIGHGALFVVDDTRKFHVAMTIHRSTTRGPFTATELEASQELLPHLRRAMQLRFLLERNREQEKLALEALDQLAAGVLILDSQARVLFANMPALEIAAAQDVLLLTDRTVRCRQREQSDVLRRLVGSAVAGGPGGSLLLSAPSRRLPGVRARHTSRRHARGVPCSPRFAWRRRGPPFRPRTPCRHFNRTSAGTVQAQSDRGARRLVDRSVQEHP